MTAQNNQPFGLPPGTVRGILALVVILPIPVLTVLGHAIPEGYLGLAGMVVGFYFGNRGKEKPA